MNFCNPHISSFLLATAIRSAALSFSERDLPTEIGAAQDIMATNPVLKGINFDHTSFYMANENVCIDIPIINDDDDTWFIDDLHPIILDDVPIAPTSFVQSEDENPLALLLLPESSTRAQFEETAITPISTTSSTLQVKSSATVFPTFKEEALPSLSVMKDPFILLDETAVIHLEYIHDPVDDTTSTRATNDSTSDLPSVAVTPRVFGAHNHGTVWTIVHTFKGRVEVANASPTTTLVNRTQDIAGNRYILLLGVLAFAVACMAHLHAKVLDCSTEPFRNNDWTLKYCLVASLLFSAMAFEPDGPEQKKTSSKAVTSTDSRCLIKDGKDIGKTVFLRHPVSVRHVLDEDSTASASSNVSSVLNGTIISSTVEPSPNSTTVHTPDDETKWFPFANALGQSGVLHFEFKGANDAHVALGSSSIQPAGRQIQDHYEVVIGGWSNTKSALRLVSNQCTQVDISCVYMGGSPVSADEFRPFRIDWTDTKLRLNSWNGSDFVSLLELDISSANYTIDRALIMTGYGSSGQWRLLSKTGECIQCPIPSNVSSVLNGTIISSTVELSPDDSPILILGNLDIEYGGTLVVKAGTVLLFEGSGINVNAGGQLLITGTLDKRVIMKAYDDQEAWNGIAFKSGSVPASFNTDMNYVSGSTIQYADLIRAGYTSFGSYSSSSGLSLGEGVVPYIVGVDMIDCAGYYYGSVISIGNFQSVAVMRNLRVLKSNHTQSYYPSCGLSVSGRNANAGLVILENANFDIATLDYSFFAASVNRVTVDRSYFSGRALISSISQVAVQLSSFSEEVYISSAGSATAHDNTFLGGIQFSYGSILQLDRNRIDKGVSISFLQSSSDASAVTNNLITNGRLYYHLSRWYHGNMTISGNTVQGSNSGGMAIHGGLTIVSNNTIKNCTSTSYPIIHLIHSGLYGISFFNNNVVGSHGSHVFRLQGSSNYASNENADFFSGNIATGNSAAESFILLESYPWTNFTMNVFDNNTAPYSVQIDMPDFDTWVLKLPLNYWGLFQADIIDLRTTVHDGLVRASQPVVDFNPLLSGPTTDSGSIAVELPGIFRSDGSLGGIVNESLTLSHFNYIASAFIIVLNGGSLTIGPNITIEFRDKCSVIVQDGAMLNITNAILKQRNNSIWGGIILDSTSNQTTTLTNSTLIGASVGVQVKSSGDLNIEHCTFKDMTSRALYLPSVPSSAQVVTLSHVNIEYPGSEAIYAGGFRGYLNLLYVNIEHPGNHAIDADSFSGHLNLLHSRIVNASLYGVYLYAAFESQILIEDNTISSLETSSTSSIYITHYSNLTMRHNDIKCLLQCLFLYHGDNTLVDQNVFRGVNVAASGHPQVEIHWDPSGTNSFSLKDNTFHDFKALYDALYVYIQQNNGGSGSIDLTDNVFYNISAGSIFDLDFRSSAKAVNIANIFQSNLVATSSSCPSSFCIANWPNSCGTSSCTLTGNVFNFTPPEGQYHLAVSENVVLSIDASYSYWGTSDETNLTAFIFDGQDEISLAMVKYLPYLLSSDADGEKSLNTTSLGFLRSGSILKGLLPQGDHIILDEAGSPYTSDGSLIIDGYLEILPNVTIQMDERSSLLIRKGELKAVGSLEQPIIFQKLSESWAGLVIENKVKVASGFKLLLAYKGTSYFNVGNDEFNSQFEDSQSKTLIRYCPQCYSSHQIIVYTRINMTTTFDAYKSMTCNFTEENNVLNSNFELYGSLEDYLNKTSKWNYCEYISGFGFPGRCGVSYGPYYQSSEFKPTCPSSTNSYQDEAYWFLYDADLPAGIYHPDWLPSELSYGLPFLFESAKDVEIEHVKILGAGADEAYSFSMKRQVPTPLKSVSILNGLGNGISISGRGSYYFENLTIESNVSSYGSGIAITDYANVTIDGYFISTSHSGQAIYAYGYGGSCSLYLYNGKVIPIVGDQYGINAHYITTLEVENFTYQNSLVGGFQYRNAIYSHFVTMLSLKNSFINCTALNSWTYALNGGYSTSALTASIKNVSFINDGYIGGFISMTYGSVVVENVRLFGGALQYDAVYISGSNVVARGIEVANVTTNGDVFDLNANENLTAMKNMVSHAKAQNIVIRLYGSWIRFEDNTLISPQCSTAINLNANRNLTAMTNIVSHAKVQDAVIRLYGSWILFEDNTFISPEGSTAINLEGDMSQLNFTHNSFIDAVVEYFVRTSAQYVQGTDGILWIGPNYWSTSSFQELNGKTYDSYYDARLVSVEFDSLFLDQELTQTILSPPSQAILDLDSMTIGGTLSARVTVIVPSGLYYAVGSIILRHPGAQLILRPGARIMFAKHASIRVDYGVLKVLGDYANPVVLSPTQNLTAEYGNTLIENSTVFGGIFFGPNSNDTQVGEGNVYIGGSFISHCEVNFGGYHSESSSIEMDHANVMLEKVTILGDWSNSAHWVHGVRIYYPTGAVVLDAVKVHGAGFYGIYIYNAYDEVILTGLDVQGSRSHGLAIDISGSVSINGCTIRSNGDDGIRITSSGMVSIRGCNIRSNADDGLSIEYSGSETVTESVFDNNGGYQIYVGDYGPSNYEMDSCVLSNSEKGVYVYKSYDQGSSSSVRGCNFTHNKNSLYIHSPQINVTLSRVHNNQCQDDNCITLHLKATHSVKFHANIVQDNTASQILNIGNANGAYKFFASILGNVFEGNKVPYSTLGSSAVVMMVGEYSDVYDDDDLEVWKIHSNEFSNPFSYYEMSSAGLNVDTDHFVINATDNYFTIGGSINNDSSLHIDGRLFDDDEGITYPKILFEPFLTDNITFFCPLNCTENGICVFPGICICKDGWSGYNCKAPTCRTLDYCNRHGICSDFEVCNCTDGWEGKACTIANCFLRNDCNDHGRCPIPNICSCDTGYTGEDCNECEADYRQKDTGECIQCPMCYNGGKCNDRAKCDCPPNYAGPTCQVCNEGFFGHGCQALPYITRAIPSDAIDLGGVDIVISGYNLDATNSTAKCLFGGIGQVDAILISGNKLKCSTPAVTLSSSGSLATYLQVIIDSRVGYNSVSFTFYSVCPENQCDKGFCSFGKCVCYHGYRGDSCNETLIPPVIADPNLTFKLVESMAFSYQFELQQGSTPVEWSLLGSPMDGMSINASSGLFILTSPAANSMLQRTTVQATNELSRSTLTINFHVSPSYLVEVSTEQSSFSRPAPTLLFNVLTRDAATLDPVGGKLAVLWVREEGIPSSQRRKVSVKTNPLGLFSAPYSPYSTDFGVFLFGGEHPTYSNLTVQGEVSIVGVDINPSYYFISGFPNETLVIQDAFTLCFKGSDFFSGINVTFDHVSLVHIKPSLSATNATSDKNTVSASLEVTAFAAVKGRIYFTVSTEDGINVSSSFIYLDVRYRTPKLVLSPNTLDIQVPKGYTAYHNAQLQNTGSLESGVMEVVVGQQDFIKPMSVYLSSLAVDESVTVSFRVYLPDDTPVGTTYYGTIGFTSYSSSMVGLDYRILVIPSESAAMTIVTTNEATYFSDEKYNLGYVDVRVRSLTVGTVYRGDSGANGTITFDDLYEDFYEVTAQKAQHSTFRKQIFLTAPGQSIEAFLQYEAVSYVFSVVPIEVTDKYEIIVETTFSTDVPKPVIIWDPVYLDWDKINSNLIDSFQLSATNKGLIAADNLTFTLPKYWRNTAFIAPVDHNLGRLNANSTLSFPVSFEQIIRYDVPSDRFELRDDKNPNTVLFLPNMNDTARWEAGPDYIMVDGDDSYSQWFYSFDGDDGSIIFSYCYKNRTRYDYVYNGTLINGTKVPVDVVITTDVNLTTESRMLFSGIPPQIEPLQHTSNIDDAARRKLFSISHPEDCLLAVACVLCDIFLGEFKSKKLAKSTSGGSKDKVEVRDLTVFAAVRLAVTIAMRICDAIGTFTSVGKFGFGIGIPLPEPISAICDALNPCTWFCPDATNLGGCVEYECNGPIELCLDINIPNIGDCSATTSPAPAPAPSPGTEISTSGGGGGGWSGCPRCGSFGWGGISLPNPCAPDKSNRRLMQQNGNMPAHMIPLHRALVNGCDECSASDLKAIFRAVDNRQSALQEAETALVSCMAAESLRSIIPCIMRKTLEVIDLIPLLSSAVRCQLNQEVCYEISDLMNNPGLSNLFIQSKRIRALIDAILLPYGDIYGDPLAVLKHNEKAFNATLSHKFSDMLVSALADSSEGGEYVTEAELETLFMGLDVLPRDDEIALFSETWNQSLALWEEGIYSSNELPANFTSNFFDLVVLEDFRSAFLSARSSLMNEHFAGFGDAWLTAVEGKQMEEAKQLAGVCASVRVQIKQELTLTRIGFEANLDIFNQGDYPLENLTVSLRVSPFGNATQDSTSLFVFGEPDLKDVTSITGGTISENSNAKITWLILPLTEAAPMVDTKYDVSGILRYSIEGILYNQGLASDTIMVKPDPQLHLKYFHSKEVFSDDPFTPEVERPVPYQLGLLIENQGYGDAYDVEILSSQPQILDNKKGLLVDFIIIGSNLNGNATMSRSLNIDFGTIPSRSKSVGIWSMISSLRGTFNNFTATFQYKGPINDDRLSLIEAVDIYELTHLVRVDGEHPSTYGLGYIDDGVPDFLANLNPDYRNIPDHVFTSDTRHSNFTVASVLDKSHISNVSETNEDEMVVTVHHNITPEERALLSNWVYIRFEDILAGSSFALDRVIRTEDNYTLIPSYNSWQTSWTDYLLSGEKKVNNFIHLFDFGVATEYRLIYRAPVNVANLRIISSTESELTIGWDGLESMDTYYALVKHSVLPDQYFKVAALYIPEEVRTIKIRRLASGTTYSVRVMPMDHNKEENVGSSIEGTTLGTSLCGNELIDMGEECDFGPLNGQDENNCTSTCVFQIRTNNASSLPTRGPSLTGFPSASPSVLPTSNPLATPSSSPVLQRSRSPSTDPSSIPTEFNSASPSSSSVPSLSSSTTTLTRSPSASPSVVSTSKKPSVTPWLSPSQLPSTSSSQSPSTSPSKNKNPSSRPSAWPTLSPGQSPTVSPSSSPSKSPVTSPSLTPTLSPSQSPSNSPSASPKILPSVSPSNSPSTTTTATYPSKQPTKSPITSLPSKSPSAIATSVTVIDMLSTVEWNITCPAINNTGLIETASIVERSLYDSMVPLLHNNTLQYVHVYRMCNLLVGNHTSYFGPPLRRWLSVTHMSDVEFSIRISSECNNCSNLVFLDASSILTSIVDDGSLTVSIHVISNGTIQAAVTKGSARSSYTTITKSPTISPTKTFEPPTSSIPTTANPSTVSPTSSPITSNMPANLGPFTTPPSHGPTTLKPTIRSTNSSTPKPTPKPTQKPNSPTLRPSKTIKTPKPSKTAKDPKSSKSK